MSKHKIFFESKRIGKFNDVESLLCLSVLIATDMIAPSSRIEDAIWFYEGVNDSDCMKCPASNKCLACIINE